MKKHFSDEDVIMDLCKENAHLKSLIKEFFEFLDRVETTEDGRDFHPITICCSRAMLQFPLEKVLFEMKKVTQDEIR